MKIQRKTLKESYETILEMSTVKKISIRIDPQKGDRLAESIPYQKDKEALAKRFGQYVDEVDELLLQWMESKGENFPIFEQKHKAKVKEVISPNDPNVAPKTNEDLHTVKENIYIIEVRAARPTVKILAFIFPAKTEESQEQGKPRKIIYNDEYPENDYRRYNKNFAKKKETPEQETQENTNANLIVLSRLIIGYDEMNEYLKFLH